MARRELSSNVQPRVSVTPMKLQHIFHEKVDSRRSLVSSEIEYLRKTLGRRATPDDIEKAVMTVRRTPWSEIAKVLDT